ncbi:hypothetical protein CRV24_009242 [Beauveria bassiana]|nr:hypothetical protein CRV24_009242 [Beauveria bassiana]KAH8707371.1 hypothetical protein HC256_010647 [Beauveria bassiana]
MAGDADALEGFDELPDAAVLRSEVTSILTLGRGVWKKRVDAISKRDETMLRVSVVTNYIRV